ncbi:hypothetical protein AGABI2DRAFT_195281, partial [Agaricus bisporus var. bisporus H97]|uniref:hypothetical protein n=1 Tax=Agaricus bisporus var. bisporus (strain H97 / ATCC MYA-4626 / FGSC 10389) TaxID=936046 RepID=UPI00029F543A
MCLPSCQARVHLEPRKHHLVLPRYERCIVLYSKGVSKSYFCCSWVGIISPVEF